jgi:PIN domain nuclease of toxin-antitoxin system
MALLIDTQILIWLKDDLSKIPKWILNEISIDSEIYFSKASVWELAIKIKTNKLIIKKDLGDFINGFLVDYEFKLLDISLSHIYHAQQFELIHRDPSNRIIAAQALVKNIQLISSDEIFDSYNVKRLW